MSVQLIFHATSGLYFATSKDLQTDLRRHVRGPGMVMNWCTTPIQIFLLLAD